MSLKVPKKTELQVLVPQFKLGKQLGADGNAIVCAAKRGGEPIAVKFLLNPDVKRYGRFRDEVLVVTTTLKDSNWVIPIVEHHLPDALGSEIAWYAMPVATPLRKHLKDAPKRDLVSALAELADSLVDLHEKKVAHRDGFAKTLDAIDGSNRSCCCRYQRGLPMAAQAEHLPVACRQKWPLYFVSCLSRGNSLNVGNGSSPDNGSWVAVRPQPRGRGLEVSVRPAAARPGRWLQVILFNLIRKEAEHALQTIIGRLDEVPKGTWSRRAGFPLVRRTPNGRLLGEHGGSLGHRATCPEEGSRGRAAIRALYSWMVYVASGRNHLAVPGSQTHTQQGRDSFHYSL